MAQKRPYLWPIVVTLVGVCLFIVSLPSGWRQWAPSFLRTPGLHLGLDLAGGTQLDFRISEEEIKKQQEDIRTQIQTLQSQAGSTTEVQQLQSHLRSIEDQERNLVEAIRTVLEKRINALGVSEATITPSYIGNEKHLLVECPGVVDVQECIKVVGKTIQLEFKEEFTEPTEDFTRGVRANANQVYDNITKTGSTLKAEGLLIGKQLGIAYQDKQWFFRDQLPAGLENLWTSQPKGVIRRDGTVLVPSQTTSGGTDKVPGIFLTEIVSPRTETGRVVNEAPKAFTLLSKSETGATYAYHANTLLDSKVDTGIAGVLRGMRAGELKVATVSGGASVLFLRSFEKQAEQVDVSHILVSYKGASGADPSVTRTKEQALARIQELKARITAGSSFEAIAHTESDGPSRTSGGSLGEVARGDMPPPFEQVAFSQKPGVVSDPVETQFGYHLIRVNKTVTTRPETASYDELKIAGANATVRGQEMIGRLQGGNVRTQEEALGLRYLFFSLLPSGWKDTALDGKHFRSATVAIDPVTNVPVVQISFDPEGARLFQELTKKNIGKRIAIFVGGEEVTRPTVNQEIAGGIAIITGSRTVEEARTLAQDLNTGAIPAPIYLVGQNTIEATLGSAALTLSLQAALIGTIILMLYMVSVYRLLGIVADIALSLYAIMLFALLKLPVLLVTKDYIVLTIAGMAGLILSIGIAVDANVLVFERMKEELRKGKILRTALETSFRHAWPAIRDSNVATLITCCILFIIGTSLVRGFAITLGMGALLSLFTAVTVTRWLLRKLVAWNPDASPALFGARRREDPPSA